MDENLNVKLIDFGFGTSSCVENLKSFKGTKTYMAPEIRKKVPYNG